MIVSSCQDGDKSDRQSWASFDIRTAQPDEPVPGLLDKVEVLDDEIELLKELLEELELIKELLFELVEQL